MKEKTTNSSKRMNRIEKQQYIENVDKQIAGLSYQDQLKIEFSKKYVNDLQLFKSEEGDQIQIGPVDKKILEYLVLTILIKYENSFLGS